MLLNREDSEKHEDFISFVKEQDKSSKDLYFEGNKVAAWVQVDQLSAVEIAWLLSGQDIKFDNIKHVKTVLAWYENYDAQQTLSFKRSERASDLINKLQGSHLLKDALMLLVINPAKKMHLIELTRTEAINTYEESEDESYD